MQKIDKYEELFGNLSEAICVPKNGFNLYIPKSGNTDEVGYFYVDSYDGHDCIAMDTESVHTYIVLSGKGDFSIDGKNIPVEEGSVVVINPNELFYYKGSMKLLEEIRPNFKEENFHIIEPITYNKNI